MTILAWTALAVRAALALLRTRGDGADDRQFLTSARLP